jgi:uncharacterized cupin superfamily protein
MRRINISAPQFDYDDTDPEGFRSGSLRCGPRLGASQLGATVYELPPGEAVCPYHYEYAEEEWLLVLTGTPTVRYPGGREELGEGDLVCFPTGPQGAHQVLNDAQETARVLMFSTVRYPAATVYPDSDKIGVWTGHREDDLLARRSSGVDYWDGERR